MSALQTFQEELNYSLARAEDYVQDYINIKGCNSLEDLQRDAIDCSPTDMGEVYHDGEHGENVMLLSLEKAKITLYSYAIYNVAYHFYEEVLSHVPEEYEAALDNSVLFEDYKKGNLIVDLMHDILEDEQKYNSFDFFVQKLSGSQMYLRDMGSPFKQIEAIVDDFMRGASMVIRIRKEESLEKFEKQVQYWQSDAPNTQKRWENLSAYTRETNHRAFPSEEVLNQLEVLHKEIAAHGKVYQEIENKKKIEEVLELFPKEIFNGSLDDLKAATKAKGIKYNFKIGKAFLLAQYLQFLFKKIEHLDTKVENISYFDQLYFKLRRTGVKFTEFILNEVLQSKEEEIRPLLTKFATENGYNHTPPNGKNMLWSPLHMAPNLPKHLHGVDLLLSCISFSPINSLTAALTGATSRKTAVCYY